MCMPLASFREIGKTPSSSYIVLMELINLHSDFVELKVIGKESLDSNMSFHGRELPLAAPSQEGIVFCPAPFTPAPLKIPSEYC